MMKKKNESGGFEYLGLCMNPKGSNVCSKEWKENIRPWRGRRKLAFLYFYKHMIPSESEWSKRKKNLLILNNNGIMNLKGLNVSSKGGWKNIWLPKGCPHFYTSAGKLGWLFFRQWKNIHEPIQITRQVASHGRAFLKISIWTFTVF